jgi:hypothetical protein
MRENIHRFKYTPTIVLTAWDVENGFSTVSWNLSLSYIAQRMKDGYIVVDMDGTEYQNFSDLIIAMAKRDGHSELRI